MAALRSTTPFMIRIVRDNLNAKVETAAQL
jgi:hypothetical protein